ncbi:hypothetical protein NSK_004210 [Nannochloropsis salina CCMP1776]|uniref:Fungal lipase-type domain-containing protein n=1 Tax=Nannochloropsis salina CCMP1776 TaxID=1027361 RepID=A0A4D9D6L6_9STRA|nr:hypothetical protein NSK_004210 [Nannochloropsis salina CCMP1776]|eukprot:TFJ84219.1 hypothetical protein NSK_004210 [Nannochloropsis salina CCMP1776]
MVCLCRLPYSFAVEPYSEDLARQAAVFSSIAYGDPFLVSQNKFYNSSCQLPGFTVLHTYQSQPLDHDAFGYIGVDKEEKLVVVAFKGSNDTEDYITDLIGSLHYHFSCVIEGVDLGHTHLGFCAFYTSLVTLGLAEEVAALAARMGEEYTVLVTGHSLGGGVASLCAVDLGKRLNVSSLLYTFGEPRAGDVGFATAVAEYSRGSYRLVHASDCVPHLPPCCGGMDGGHCAEVADCPFHHGQEIWYDDDMSVGAQYVACPGDEDEDVCSNGSISSVEDHHYYFGERLGTWCCFPPPPSERSSEMERKRSMIEQRIKTLESHGRMSRSEAERTGVTAVV